MTGDKMGRYLIAFVLIFLFGAMAGMLHITHACNTTTFFQVGTHSYECLPYHKGMLNGK